MTTPLRPNTSTETDAVASDVERLAYSELAAEYDFVVCGAGSSGSGVARRLAENPDESVLLLEAGRSPGRFAVMRARVSKRRRPTCSVSRDMDGAVLRTGAAIEARIDAIRHAAGAGEEGVADA